MEIRLVTPQKNNNMKRLLTFTLSLLTLLSFSGCEKEIDNPADNNEFDFEQLKAFVGEYSLTISYTCDINGEEQPGTAVQNGTLSISQMEDPEVVEVVGNFPYPEINFDVYRTLGTLNSDGQLQLEDNTFVIEGMSDTSHISYEPISLQQPLTFKTEVSFEVNGLQITYHMNNTATRK